MPSDFRFDPVSRKYVKAHEPGGGGRAGGSGRDLKAVLGLKDLPPEPPPEKEQSWREWGAMGLRGAAGFVPGGPWGAAAGGLAELGAEALEGRAGFDSGTAARVATQAGIGFIPFGGKLKSVGQAALRGATHGAIGSGATNIAEQLTSDKELSGGDFLRSVGTGATIGGVAGGATRKIGDALGIKGPQAPAEEFERPIATRPIGPSRPPQIAPTAPAPEPTQGLADVIGAPRPKLSATETADMLAGRQKFASKAGVEYGSGEVPPGTFDELDRMGVEYGRTQSELKRLLGLADADPAEIGRMDQGARELGSRLRGTAKKATPKRPQVQQEQQQLGGGYTSSGARIPDEILPPETTQLATRQDPLNALEVVDEIPHAQTRPQARDVGNLANDMRANLEGVPTSKSKLASLLGDETGEASPEAAYAMASAGIGAGAGYVLSDDDHKGLSTVAGGLAGLGAFGAYKRPDIAEQYVTAGMLSSPKTGAKIISGNVGGPLIKAAQKAFVEKDPSIPGRTLKELFSGKTVDAFKNKFADTSNTDVDRLGPGYATSGPAAVPGKIIGSLDAATKDYTGRAGFTPDEQAVVTMTNEPESPLLSAMLAMQRKHQKARIPFPFFKTAANAFEQGLVNPVKSGGQILKGEGTRQDVANLATMLGVGGAGYAAGEMLPAWAEPFASAAMGPYMAPAAIGSALSHTKEGSTPMQKATAGFRSAAQQMPLAEAADYDPRQLLARTVPNVARDAAQLLDPKERVTNEGLFDPALAKVPFVREWLKPKKKPRNRRRD